MDKKARKKKIFDEIRADQARYDATTRLLEERIAYYQSRRADRRRESS
jgi:hypothetical protein